MNPRNIEDVNDMFPCELCGVKIPYTYICKILVQHSNTVYRIVRICADCTNFWHGAIK